MKSTGHCAATSRITSELKMGTALICILFFSFSLSSKAQQVDNDLVFDENNVKGIRNEETKSELSSLENFRQNVTEPEKSADMEEDFFFNRFHHNLHRLRKRAALFWDNIFNIITTETPETWSTEKSPNFTNSEARKSTVTFKLNKKFKEMSKKNDGVIPVTRNSVPEVEEDDTSEDDDDDEDDNGSASSSSTSNLEDTSTLLPVSQIENEQSKKSYFRLVIKLLLPYSKEIANMSSTEFMEYEKSLPDAIKQVLETPDFVKPRLAAILNTAQASASKAVIDLEMSGSESINMIRQQLLNHLKTEKKLGNVAATDDGLKVFDFGDSFLKTCEKDFLPCLSSNSLCYSILERCDGIVVCPVKSDEEDCPGQDVSPPNGINCDRGDDSFTCEGKKVIICESQKCDGKKDCPNGDDELNCKPICSDDEFACNKSCIPLSKRCDGIQDCSDPDDESESICEGRKPSSPGPTTSSTCSPEEFICGDTCLPNSKRCDGTQDCLNPNDEADCSTTWPRVPLLPQVGRHGILMLQDLTLNLESTTRRTCPISCNFPLEFQCKSGNCIPIALRCNELKQCNDGSDEENCRQTGDCENNENKCYDGSCYLKSKRCNQYPDCPQGEDELNCPTTVPFISSFSSTTSTATYTTSTPQCEADEFQCNNGKCVNKVFFCDGYDDCHDNSDENNCTARCYTREFQCQSGNCIPESRRCDRVPDCPDRSDELNCQQRCITGEFQCQNGDCIAEFRRCDRFSDCPDGSDELNCQPRCVTGEFQCQNGDCIAEFRRCDRFSDCPDGSDELNCQQGQIVLKAVPNEQIIKQGQEVVFQCRDEGPLRAKVEWIRDNGLPLPPGTRILDLGRLEIPDIQLNHAGVYICRAVQPYSQLPGAQIKVQLEVEPFIPPTRAAPIRCQLNEATCRSGECIPKSSVCDGHRDCSDGSDEECTDACEPNQFRCDNRRCINKAWYCDSEDDCLDGSDEPEDCRSSTPGSVCRNNEFTCHNLTQCIPKSMQCDHEPDCNDGTDEIGCTKPIITVPPPSSVRVYVGSVFMVTCQAIGVPTAEIVWRLNWGHVPIKCRMTSIDGIGTLTCPDIQREDQGAYSCEAINGRGSTFAPIDTILEVSDLALQRICERGKFNDLAKNLSECIDCFCFGITNECKSAMLYMHQLPPPTNQFNIINVHFDRRRNETDFRTNEINTNFSVDVLGSGDSFKIHTLINLSLTWENVFPYLNLPSYTGNRLKSYGGFITYIVSYEDDGPPLHNPNIILSGNGYKLSYGGKPFIPGFEKYVKARLFFGSWYHANESSDINPSIGKLATREEIMMTLQNLDYVLLKLQYTASPRVDVTIKDFRFDSASAVVAGEQATYVEECRCPSGYSGLSCESCAPGYSRSLQREETWLGECTKIDSCPFGTYGDPWRGFPCTTCPCPSTSSSNQFSHSCFLDTDGRPTCICPVGYEGRNCERCSIGFIGNPVISGSSCRRTPCDFVGSTRPILDPARKTCPCKQNVDGTYCNQCKENTFYLAPSNLHGCISCFCMGITNECTSSNWYRQQIRAGFGRDTQEFMIARRQEILVNPVSTFNVNAYEGEILYNAFGIFDTEVYYWILPQRFLNDKITSYGGFLNYTLRYTPAPGGQSSRNNAPDVEIISGNNVRLLYFKRGDPLQPDAFQTVSVPLLEQFWQREDGQVMNREHFLMALADVRAILIKATYTTSTKEVGLQSVILETAENRNTGLRRAYEVEECRCPPGYKGLSCQECDVGFYRSDEGLYLGTCKPCECHGYTNECDPVTGICLNCRNHTTGDACEKCEIGFVGNPASGISCSPVNSFEFGCQCDTRGRSEPHCINGVCNCKVNVMGRYCDTCKPGTFDLRENRDTGCIDCYCCGVTKQCQSSNMYVTQIPMPLVNNDHGFTLTDSNRNRYITSGFITKPALSQIEYDYVTERGQRLYWSLPPQFTGNKVTSYGGNLTWTQGYKAPSDAQPLYDNDLVIIGDGISVYWTNNYAISANSSVTISVKLEEKDFRRITKSGTQSATRTDFMRILSNIEAILIRASYASQTTYVYISDVSLDMAVDQPLSSLRATQVEMCSCPPGYKGSSCERCDVGYYHALSRDGVTKECKRCPCNDNEESCLTDASSRVLCKCKVGFSGEFCEDRTDLIMELKPLVIRQSIGTRANVTCSYRSSSRHQISFMKNYKNARSKVPPIYGDTKSMQEYCSRSITCWTSQGNISFVVERDLLSVRCDVANENGIIFGQMTALINPSVPESITAPISIKVKILEPALKLVAVNQTVQYKCEANSLNQQPISISWSKKGENLPVGRSIDDGTGYLVIMNVVPSDSGIYVCTANDGIYFASQEIHMTVGEANNLKVMLSPYHPSGILSLYAGNSITIDCEASGIPVPIVELSHAGVPLKTGLQKVSLTINSASEDDAGFYYCKGSNELGTGYEKLDIKISKNAIEPDSFIGIPGSTVQLRCLLNRTPGYRISWTKLRNEPLPRNADVVNETLTIYNAAPENSGIYECKVVSEITGTIGAQATVDVSIYNIPVPPTVNTGKPPILTIDPEKQTVPQGSLAIIRCITNDPNSNISWQKADGEFTSGVQIRGNEIRIPSVQVKDRGMYVCYSENDFGFTRVGSQLEVDKREIPVIEIYPAARMITYEGSEVMIQCQVKRGIPQPRVRWSRPGSSILSSRVTEVNGVLKISEVHAEDEGQYVCIADNIVGTVEAIAYIEVISSPSVSIRPSGPITVEVGQRFRLECSASGKPPPAVQWRINTAQASPDVPAFEKVDGHSQTAVFEILKADLLDSGEYTCMAKNDAGISENSTIVRVIPSFGATNVPEPPIEEVTFPVGSNAKLRCNTENQRREAMYKYWSRDDRIQLPEKHEEKDGTLIIYNIQPGDGGKYTCNTVNGRGQSKRGKTIKLKIIVPPQITLEPMRQLVHPGDDAYITCSAQGDEPITIYWSAVDGPLPRTASFYRGLLQFRGITVNDAGRYVCRAQNSAGTAEGVAEVIVKDVRGRGPEIVPENSNQYAFEGSDLDLKCTLKPPYSNYNITWRRERSELPRNFQTIGNTLRLMMVKPEDSGRYICQVTTLNGNSSSHIDVLVERSCLEDEFRCHDGTCILGSKICDLVPDCADYSDERNCHYHRRGVNNNVTLALTNLKEVYGIGETINVSCLVTGIPNGKVMWSKVGGRLENNVQIRDNMLRIIAAQITNRGTYRCIMSTREGEHFIDFQPNIQDYSPSSAPVTLKLNSYGKDVDLICDTDLTPPVNYSWVVHSYKKSLHRVVPNAHILRISRATVNDSGLYFCHVENKDTSFTIPTMLVITEVIPAFKERSYLTLPPLTQVTNSFDIEITFKPKNYEGLILFSGQSKDLKGDFISFGLQSGLPELRFNLGTGAAVIKATEPLKLNKWHTVRLIRNFREGTMVVNGRYNYTGMSPGKYETLDLLLPLFVGGVTNYKAVSEITNLNTGFTGCINRLIVNSRSFNLKKESLQSYQLDSCDNCKDNPCENNGACQETNSPEGYTCICPPGFSGENCILRKNTCYLDTCGEGQCLENESGIECQCPLGKGGKNCRKNINIDVPAFTKNSFIAYTTPLMKRKLLLSMTLKPVGESYVEDGIILYTAENENGLGDFISISIINSYIELKGQIMSKPIYLRSDRYLIPNEYVNLFLNIDSNQLRFSIDNETVLAEEFNPNDSINDLRLHTPLYVGGYDKKLIILPENVVVRNGFHGCISKLELSEIDIPMLQSYVSASNINDCLESFGDICQEQKPCQNSGKCLTTRDTYKCECPQTFSGQNCEKQKNLCEILTPCKNNGKCTGTINQYKCFCGLGFTGSQCELETTLEESVNFNGDGYVELNASLLPHDTMDEVIDVKFTTSASTGLLFWQGQSDNTDEFNDDFIAIAIENGYVQLSYRNAFSGRKVLSATDHKVNDGLLHSVSVRRSESQITVELDVKTSDLSQITGRLNTRGNIYIGGLPNVRFMTGNQYTSGFVGCVQLLKIHDRQPINFGQKAISASNANPCPFRTETNEV